MSGQPNPDLTALLQAAQRGETGAFDAAFTQVYHELQRMARHMRQKGGGDTINTTALVHEAYLKMMPAGEGTVENRAHFFGIAVRAMRQILIRYAEKRMTQKRGSGQAPVSLDEVQLIPDEKCEEVIALHEALNRLATFSPRQSQVVEYRFFAGLTIDETADVMGVSVRTLHRDWNMAKAWLSHEINTMR